MNSHARKRRTREHIIADLSVNHVERHALLCGYTLERFRHDYGIDLRLFTYGPKGDLEDGNILLQLKASDRVRLRKGLEVLSFRIDQRDLVHWLAQAAPVILIVYDAKRDISYWVYSKATSGNERGSICSRPARL